MTSFIIIAKEKKKRETYAKEYANKQQIDTFDITLIEKDTSPKQNTQSIGIETVKLIQQKLFLKPIKSENKLVIIEDAQLLTPEAQNALLKVLEEPPEHTIILLGTDAKEALLPTILSRCQIIILEEEQTKLSEKELLTITEFLEMLPNLSIGERLKKAEQLAKDKEKALVLIENLILVMREQLVNNVILVIRQPTEHPGSDSGQARLADASAKRARMTNVEYLLFLKSLQSLHTLLKTTNVNPRFAIEMTLLSL